MAFLAPESAGGASWAQREFQRSDLADERDQPFQPDIRSWVIVMGRMAGGHPSKRQPLPGNEVFCRACVQLQMMVRVIPAARAP